MAVVVAKFIGKQQASGTANTFELNPASISAGSVLCVIGANYTTAQTLTGVSDTVNGAWTRALINGTDNYVDVAAIDMRLGAFYFLNAAAGANTTVTLTWSGNARKAAYLIEITGLTGGGALDQCIGASYSGSSATTLSAGTFATLAQAAEGLVSMYVGSNAETGSLSGWTDATDIDGFYYERGQYQVTASTTGPQAGWSIGSAGNAVTVALAFKDLGAGGGPTAAIKSQMLLKMN